ncbi:MAG TPA: hypothetical protein VJH90_02045 [archaeon]|nr:hypothetical protein [archaeon]
MSSIDMVVSALLMLSIIGFALFFTSNNLEKSLSNIKDLELKASLSYFSNQLLTEDSPASIVAEQDEAAIRLEEIGDYQHSESLEWTVTPAIQSPKLYDYSFDEVAAVVEQNSGSTKITASANFFSKEKKHLKLFYDGSISSISFVAVNVTSTSAVGKKSEVVSLASCGSLDYENMLLVSKHQFRLEIGGCTVGPEPPEADVYKEDLAILGRSGDSIAPLNGRLLMW